MDFVTLPKTLIEYQALFLAIGYIACATAVTLHVLSTKRDVPTIIVWVGLAWLLPYFGSLLYVCLGINRVSRRARRLFRSGSAPAPVAPSGGLKIVAADRLRTAIGHITGKETTAGAISEILICGDEAYPRMLRAIENARSSIALSTYIFRTDSLGLSFIKALADAHRRGVAVRVLIDGIGGGYLRSPAYHRLRKEGVPVARFLHTALLWKMPLLNLRLHKKLLLVDGEIAFAGGLNIGADNLLAERPKLPVLDTHFRISGPVVQQIMKIFQDDWFFTTSEVLDGAAWSRGESHSDGKPARAIESGPDQDVDHLMLVLLSAINSAQNTIRIATPYFLPDEVVLLALQLASLRGVSVNLVMPAVNDHHVMTWAARGHIRPLLERGCKIWRSPLPFDHSKLMTIDDNWCLIGSANWDARSLRLSFEITVEFYDADMVGQLSKIIDLKCIDQITLAELDGRLGIVKVRDAAARLLMAYL
jgi:cardiolipin synthase A/B